MDFQELKQLLINHELIVIEETKPDYKATGEEEYQDYIKHSDKFIKEIKESETIDDLVQLLQEWGIVDEWNYEAKVYLFNLIFSNQ